MTEPDRFPPELLQKSIEARLEFFKNTFVSHPRLEEAHNRLIHAIRHPCGASLIFVFGPTGVGKTTLCQGVENQLLEEEQLAMEQDPGYIPVVRMEVKPPESGNFRWKDYYLRALETMDETMIDSKVDFDAYGIRRNANGQLVINRLKAREDDLGKALEGCLKNRHPLAFFADEAQHLKKLSGGRRLLDQMDNIKSLASQSKTLHVLIGTYELLDLTNLSAQLSRRSIEIHFPRYCSHSQEDVNAFGSVLIYFQHFLPLTQEPDLTSDPDYFYMQCCGCVGTLKDWLHRALALALEDNEGCPFFEYLEECAKPTRQVKNMFREIWEGERNLMETPDQTTHLRQLMGLGPSTATNEPEKEQESHNPKPQPRRVGERNPVRDPVGV